MRISEAVAETADIEVPFGTATLHVTYRPLTFTVAEMEDAASKGNDPRRIIEMIKRMVVSWDLERDDLVDNETGKGVLVPLDHPEDDYEHDPLREVGTHIFTKIAKTVAQHQSLGDQGKPSGAS